MSYVPPASMLRGLSVEKASMFGAPHVGAYYSGAGVNTHKLQDGARCAICGRKATNAHHAPAKGTAPYWGMQTDWGLFMLKPALIALCGSGTRGCHGDVHNGRASLRWEWADDEAAESWFSGRLLSHGYEPHDARLLDMGRWTLTANGETRTL